MRGRVVHIDIAKGISIVLVAMFHSNLKFSVPELIEPMSLFRMPLFLVLSGVFFSCSLPPKQFFFKKADSLLKPYFFVLTAALLFYMAVDGDVTLWKLKGIFYGNGDTIQWDWVPLWFLTHLFALYVFVYFLYSHFHFDRLEKGKQLTVLLVFMSVGTLTLDVFWYVEVSVFGRSLSLPGLPFSIDIILISATYFILGAMLRERIARFSPNTLMLVLATVVFVAITLFTDAHTDLNKRVYDSPLYAFFGAAAGIYGVLTLSWYCAKIKWLGDVFLALGQASLFIMIFHVFTGYWIYSILTEGTTDKINLFVMAVIACLLSIVIPLLIKRIVERSALLSLAFFPFRSNHLLRHALRVHRRSKVDASQ
ncbi:MAG: hypothetical protein CMI09_12635 [Oceanospirillaceae bacterium]|nr:hypothetical protein [Oceanospirillaceae bacterium]